MRNLVKRGKLIYESDKNALKIMKTIGIILLIGGMILLLLIFYLIYGGLIHAFIFGLLPFCIIVILYGIWYLNHYPLKIFKNGILIPKATMVYIFEKKRKFILFKNIKDIVIRKNNKRIISVIIESNERLFDEKIIDRPLYKNYEINRLVVGDKGINKLLEILKKYCPEINIRIQNVD